MATIGEDLIAVLVGSTNVTGIAGTRVQQNSVNVDDDFPRIWLGRSGSEEDLDLSAVGGLRRDDFDVECMAEGTQANDTGLDSAIDLAEKAKTLLSGKRGSFGSRSVQGVFVLDHDDDYVPKGITEDGVHIAALQVQIWYATT